MGKVYYLYIIYYSINGRVYLGSFYVLKIWVVYKKIVWYKFCFLF